MVDPQVIDPPDITIIMQDTSSCPFYHRIIKWMKQDAEATSGSDVHSSRPFYLRIIKRIALIFIAIFICVGAVLSKVTLVSITARMYNLSSEFSEEARMYNLSSEFSEEAKMYNLSSGFSEEETLLRSALFIQLIFLLVIPEAVSFIRCLIWGVIGKTTESFPWPSRIAFILVSWFVYLVTYSYM